MDELLWIDDAASYMLQPLARMLARRGWAIHTLTTYQDAVKYIEHLRNIGGSPTDLDFPYVLLDVLIPRKEGGTLDNIEVGFSLARRCANQGAKRIVFFSVVAKARVSVELSKLEEEHPATEFFYVEKTAGGPLRLLEDIERCLANNDS
jgi:hypothetical protein